MSERDGKFKQNGSWWSLCLNEKNTYISNQVVSWIDVRISNQYMIYQRLTKIKSGLTIVETFSNSFLYIHCALIATSPSSITSPLLSRRHITQDVKVDATAQSRRVPQRKTIRMLRRVPQRKTICMHRSGALFHLSICDSKYPIKLPVTNQRYQTSADAGFVHPFVRGWRSVDPSC